MGDNIMQKAESQRETHPGDMQIERPRLGRERDRDSEQEQTRWTRGKQGQEASGIDSSLSTWEQHRQFLEAGNIILQAGHPLSNSTEHVIPTPLEPYAVLSSAKLSQVVEPVCYKDTSDKTVQESANRGKRLAFDASMLASSSSTVKSEVPQLPEPNQNRDIGNRF